MAYSLKKATAWNLAGYLYLLLASFLTTPSLIRYLGVTQFARYALALGVVSIISALDLGLSRSTVYYLIQAKSVEEKGKVFASAFVLNALLAFIFAAGALILHFPLVAILIAGTFLLAQVMTYPESKGNFALVNLRNFIVGTANTFGAVYVAKEGGGVSGILELLAGSMLLTSLVVARVQSLQGKPSHVIIGKLLRYGLGNQLGKAIGQLESQYAKFLLAFSPFAVSVYTLASSLVVKSVGGVTQMSAALFPHSAESFHKPEFRRLYHRLQLILAMVGLAAAVLYQFVGLPFLSWWLGAGPLSFSVHSFLLIFRFYAVLLLLTPVASTVVDSLGKPLVTSLFGLANLILEVIFFFLLYPIVGLLAPAYAGVISLGLLVPIFLIFTEKILARAGTESH